MNKWLSVRLRTTWFWVRVQLQLLKLQISRLLPARSSLTFRQYSGHSLWNALRDMTRTYSQLRKFNWNVMKRNLCIFKGTSLVMNEKNEKRFEKKKNFERLRNNRILNGILGNSCAFSLYWEVTIKSVNLAKHFLKLIYLEQNITIVCFFFFFISKKINKFSYLYFLPF